MRLGKKKSEATEGLVCTQGLPLSSFYRRDSQEGFAYLAVLCVSFPFVRVSSAAQRLRITVRAWRNGGFAKFQYEFSKFDSKL